MPALASLRQSFIADAWPALKGRSPFSINLERPKLFSDGSPTSLCIQIALWDLMAKILNLPLYQLLGGKPEKNRVRAYGSGLDYHLNEPEAMSVFQHFVRQGFTAVKVKVGRPNVHDDLRRLYVVRQTVGAEVEIAIDANEAWDAEEALKRVKFFQAEGLNLSYVEDPLARDDIDGLAKLKAAIDIDVVGHDYVMDHKIMRRYLERNALSRLRVSPDPDFALASSDLASEFGVPLIFGNSMFELSVHPAVALPNVDRMEFSNLDWNLIPKEPIRFENGYAIAPKMCGHGLDPDPDALARYDMPDASPSSPPSVS
jgi:L-alanine-DL-glutamate epimerase-like enolase superfamily enzyme